MIDLVRRNGDQIDLQKLGQAWAAKWWRWCPKG
jgi:hypothetical protein